MGKKYVQPNIQPNKIVKNKQVSKDINISKKLESISKEIIANIRKSNLNLSQQKSIKEKQLNTQKNTVNNNGHTTKHVESAKNKQVRNKKTFKEISTQVKDNQRTAKKNQNIEMLKNEIYQTIKESIQKESSKQKEKNQAYQYLNEAKQIILSDSEMDKQQALQAQNLFAEIYSSSQQEKQVKSLVPILKTEKKEPQNSFAEINKPASYVKKQLHKNEKKRVSFEQIQLVQFQPDRKWDVPMQQQRKGKFSPQQHKRLIASLHTYLSINNLEFSELKSMLIEDDEEEQEKQKKRKIWTTICSAIPNRSIRSCYRYLKRQLDDNNYKGSWDKQEQEKLVLLIEKYGRKWAKIGKQMQRTADNIRDKYRQMGEEKNQDISQGMWAFKQLVEFLKLIKRHTHVSFLNLDIEIQAQNAEQHDNKQKLQYKQRKYNSKKFIFHNNSVVSHYINNNEFQKIDASKIKWHKIAEKLTTRTPIQCRNKFVQLMQINYKETVSFQIDQQIVKFLVSQNVQNEDLVKWNQWDTDTGIDGQQAVNRWKVMKKHIEGRMRKSFRQVLAGVQQSLRKKQKGKRKREQLIQ